MIIMNWKRYFVFKFSFFPDFLNQFRYFLLWPHVEIAVREKNIHFLVFNWKLLIENVERERKKMTNRTFSSKATRKMEKFRRKSEKKTIWRTYSIDCEVIDDFNSHAIDFNERICAKRMIHLSNARKCWISQYFDDSIAGNRCYHSGN